MKKPLQSLRDYGQSLWLYDLHRRLITSGELARMVEEDGLRGLTSNPSILENAMTNSSDYWNVIKAPESKEMDAKTLYERIAVHDVQDAADVLHSVYVESERRDGYVSLEVSPLLVHESQEMCKEARRLWQAVARDNLMIKVPGTPEGIPIVQQLISEGINVYVTLLFTQQAYEQAADAYISGLESFAQRDGDLGRVASVADYSISKIDTIVDHWIVERQTTSHTLEEQALFRFLLGRVAIASAKKAYQNYLGIYRGGRWQRLSQFGARSQRLAWSSTGAENQAYRDVLYVEELIGPDTINILPPATLSAFRDHGKTEPTLTKDVEEAMRVMDLVELAGIPFKELTDKLLIEGIQQCTEAYNGLLKATSHRGKISGPDLTSRLRIKLFRELFKGRQYT